MISNIISDNVLKDYICKECSENGISLIVSESISPNDIVIISVDKYYNALVKDPPPSPDCLVILKCKENVYNVFIVELKNIKDQQYFTINNVVDKFITCLDDFMSNRFANHFFDNSELFSTVKLFFITDPYGFKVDPEKQLKMQGHKLDALMAQRIPKFFDKHLYIEYKLPNPTINPC